MIHPEAVSLYSALAHQTPKVLSAKDAAEAIVLRMRAKGLTPNPDGSPPESLGVDESGTIGGNASTLSYEDCALGLQAYAMIGAVLGSQLGDTGRTVEEQLRRMGVA